MAITCGAHSLVPRRFHGFCPGVFSWNMRRCRPSKRALKLSVGSVPGRNRRSFGQRSLAPSELRPRGSWSKRHEAGRAAPRNAVRLTRATAAAMVARRPGTLAMASLHSAAPFSRATRSAVPAPAPTRFPTCGCRIPNSSTDRRLRLRGRDGRESLFRRFLREAVDSTSCSTFRSYSPQTFPTSFASISCPPSFEAEAADVHAVALTRK